MCNHPSPPPRPRPTTHTLRIPWCTLLSIAQLLALGTSPSLAPALFIARAGVTVGGHFQVGAGEGGSVPQATTGTVALQVHPMPTASAKKTKKGTKVNLAVRFVFLPGRLSSWALLASALS